MQDFTAIDFETANNEKSSVCSIGIVIVRNGEIVEKFYSLIKPEPEYYIIGAHVYMDFAMKTQKMLRYFRMYGCK